MTGCRALREFEAKQILASVLPSKHIPLGASFSYSDSSLPSISIQLDQFALQHPALCSPNSLLVVKIDQLIKRRGKNNLVALALTWPQVRQWIEQRANSQLINLQGQPMGLARHFLIEQYIPHSVQHEEFYLCMRADKDADEIMFCEGGGVDVGEQVEKRARKICISPSAGCCSESEVESLLLSSIIPRVALRKFIVQLYSCFCRGHFDYLEINPLVVTAEQGIWVVDVAAKVDTTAEFECFPTLWPCQFGSISSASDAVFRHEEEEIVRQLDSRTGASLKLSILNPKGRIWMLVAGGGASIAFADAITAAGHASQLGNYGEYSGAPTEQQTFEYAQAVLRAMLSEATGEKILFVAGGIANFTPVQTTFRGIVRALEERVEQLKMLPLRIWARRGGPGWKRGLQMIREFGLRSGIEVHAYGPERALTGIVGEALCPVREQEGKSDWERLEKEKNELALSETKELVNINLSDKAKFQLQYLDLHSLPDQLFTSDSKALVWGLQTKAIQSMLDFDFMASKPHPSVVGIIYPFTTAKHSRQQFFWSSTPIFIPIYSFIPEACLTHTEASIAINFASNRSALETCTEFINCPSIKVLVCVAEGVPQRHSRTLAQLCRDKRPDLTFIGPATVGGVRPGCFKIGNSAGTAENVALCSLHKAAQGGISYVTKSGGMSNELNMIISRVAPSGGGVCEGIAVGGDRWPGSTMLQHLMRFQMDSNCLLMVLLGEVGGGQEMEVCEALRAGLLTKPLVAWCLGTSAPFLQGQLSGLGGLEGIQFGHAGSLALGPGETAEAKNRALAEAGAFVPGSFEEFEDLLAAVWAQIGAGNVEKDRAQSSLSEFSLSQPSNQLPPLDFDEALEQGLVRRKPQILSSICDERGPEVTYNNLPISQIIHTQSGVGAVLGLLWFKKSLAPWICSFIELVLIIVADHGPAVSAAHCTIVASRAAKDLVSSLCSGLLCIGERFGGAIDGAARQFSQAYDQSLEPRVFVEQTKRQSRLIMGIGHRVKSLSNPDSRVELIKEFVASHFPKAPLFAYALEVERITVQKKDNLILNVDGAIGVAFVDILRESGAFTRGESEEYLRIGALNGLFVLGRSIGLIGHHLDQQRMQQPLYRQPWDDVFYCP